MNRDIRTTCDCQFTVTIAYALTGQMNSGQRRRAHGIHRHTWSMKIAEIGDPVSDPGGIASQSDRSSLGLCLHPKELVFLIHHPYKDAHIASQPVALVHAELFTGIACVLQGSKGTL